MKINGLESEIKGVKKTNSDHLNDLIKVKKNLNQIKITYFFIFLFFRTK